MHECANFCENRLISYLGADNAALGTNVRKLRVFAARSVKTTRKGINKMQAEVKTELRPRFPYEQTDETTFARCRKVLRGSADAKYTYFMRDRRSGLIKIGMSNDPEDRRARLSSSGARDMEILLTLRDGNLEGCYHKHFADLRVGGEWFEPHADILAEIERCSAQTRERNIG